MIINCRRLALPQTAFCWTVWVYPVNLHDLYGDKVIVLSFIYTRCNDVNGCPLATYVLSQTQKRIARDAGLKDAVRLISVSFDPRNDTPAVLHEYRKSFAGPDVDWRFLTLESDVRARAAVKSLWPEPDEGLR